MKGFLKRKRKRRKIYGNTKDKYEIVTDTESPKNENTMTEELSETIDAFNTAEPPKTEGPNKDKRYAKLPTIIEDIPEDQNYRGLLGKWVRYDDYDLYLALRKVPTEYDKFLSIVRGEDLGTALDIAISANDGFLSSKIATSTPDEMVEYIESIFSEVKTDDLKSDLRIDSSFLTNIISVKKRWEAAHLDFRMVFDCRDFRFLEEALEHDRKNLDKTLAETDQKDLEKLLFLINLGAMYHVTVVSVEDDGWGYMEEVSRDVVDPARTEAMRRIIEQALGGKK